MRKSRLGRPSREQLKALKPMSEKHYRELEKACVVAYMTRKTHVILALSYLTKLPDDFPPTVIVKREGLDNHVKVKAPKLLRWLNDKGYSDVTAEALRQAFIKFTSQTKELLLD